MAWQKISSFLQIGHLDVTKQNDLSGFYRHLYRQTFAEEDAKKPEEQPVTFRKETADAEAKSKRQYRPRRDEQEEEEEQEPAATSRPTGQPTPEPEDVKPDVNELEKTVGSEKSKQKGDERSAASASLVTAAETDRAAAADRAAEKSSHEEKPKLAKKRRHSESSEEDEEFEKPATPPPPPVKVKIDVWKKRTTEETIQEALERYRARKQAREDGLVFWP